MNPYRIDGPAIISFSGGRTSAMMLWHILDAHDGKLPDDIKVVFANTGREMPETLDFVHECGRRWGVHITWLEYLADLYPQHRWCITDYAAASRDGQPFADLIRQKSMLPNPVTRFCTSELKIRPTKLYAQQALGWRHWDVVIGFRADEPARVARLSKPHKEPYDRVAPLAAAGVTSLDVYDFWAGQPFDLHLPNMAGKTPHGNCDLCFLKGGAQIFSLIRERPERADWWIEQESRIPRTIGMGGHLFRANRPSYRAMRDMAVDQGEMFCFAADAALADCACTD